MLFRSEWTRVEIECVGSHRHDLDREISGHSPSKWKDDEDDEKGAERRSGAFEEKKLCRSSQVKDRFKPFATGRGRPTRDGSAQDAEADSKYEYAYRESGDVRVIFKGH